MLAGRENGGEDRHGETVPGDVDRKMKSLNDNGRRQPFSLRDPLCAWRVRSAMTVSAVHVWPHGLVSRLRSASGTIVPMSLPLPPSSTPEAPLPVASPCVRRCTLDQDDVCIGCGRTLDDIRQWGAMSNEQRGECVARAAQRRHERELSWQPGPGPGPGPG